MSTGQKAATHLGAEEGGRDGQVGAADRDVDGHVMAEERVTPGPIERGLTEEAEVVRVLVEHSRSLDELAEKVVRPSTPPDLRVALGRRGRLDQCVDGVLELVRDLVHAHAAGVAPTISAVGRRSDAHVQLRVRPDTLLVGAKVEERGFALIVTEQRDHRIRRVLHRLRRRRELRIGDARVEIRHDVAVDGDAGEGLDLLARELIAEPGDGRDVLDLAIGPGCPSAMPDREGHALVGVSWAMPAILG